MTTKEYLGKISRLEKMIENKYSEIRQNRELAQSVDTISYGLKVKSTPDIDRMGKVLSKIDGMERELALQICRFCIPSYGGPIEFVACACPDLYLIFVKKL